MALMICPKCENKLSDKAKKCPHCGISMEDIIKILEGTNNAPEIVVCPECGAEFKATEEACPECGMPIEYIYTEEEETAAEPEIHAYPENIKCAVCGAEYSSGDMVCPECGYPKLILSKDMAGVRKAADGRRVSVYLNELMAECKVRRLEDLAFRNEAFDGMEAYKKIMSSGDESVKAELKRYLDCIDERKRKAEMQKAYDYAKELMSKADTEEAYLNAAKKFESLADYMNSNVLVKKCYEEAERCRKDKIYTSAKNKMTEQSVVSYEEAIRLFKSISGWKDADALIKNCQQKIDELKKTSSGNKKAADIIKFGRYEQGSGVKPIEWQVLDRKDNKALVISKYALEFKEYNNTRINTWEKCTLRAWLNNEFISKAFNSEEQAAIATTICYADQNSKHGTNSGNYTKDKVFLLSVNEARKYFKSDDERICIPTEYAKSKRAGYSAGGKSTCWWWLRTPGNYEGDETYVINDGFVSSSGTDVRNYDIAVRPVLWINLDEYDKYEIRNEQQDKTKHDENSSNQLKDGKIVEFGNYRAAPIEWQILEQRGDKVMLISKNAIEFRKYNVKRSDVTWETCDLRKWLNSTFLNQAFIEEERKRMVPSIHIAEKNPKYGTSPGSNTQDTLFLLSVSEAEKYFSNNAERICFHRDNKESCCWWLRTSGVSQNFAANVERDGSVSKYGLNVDYNLFAVRPAVWVQL